jgi:hypothetical protein
MNDWTINVPGGSERDHQIAAAAARAAIAKRDEQWRQALAEARKTGKAPDAPGYI